MVRKQNQRSDVLRDAEHSLRKDAMLYNEQISNALTNRPQDGWRVGQSRDNSSLPVARTSLAKSNCSSIRIKKWLGSMKSATVWLVNWNRVESRRDRSKGSIICILPSGGLSRHCSPTPHCNRLLPRLFQHSRPRRFTEAAKLGIPTVSVPPQGTSQTCPRAERRPAEGKPREPSGVPVPGTAVSTPMPTGLLPLSFATGPSSPALRMAARPTRQTY